MQSVTYPSEDQKILEEEYLMISGIQHFAFCPRQWGLIHLEQQWGENYLTTTGKILHEKVDDPFFRESRGPLVVNRAMRLISHELCLSGQADAVEFHRLPTGEIGEGVVLENHEGRWLPRPVEYKRGRPKTDERDAVQLCAQAICLEEMLGVSIEEGDLFYGEIRRREKVIFSKELRQQVRDLASGMRKAFLLGRTPNPTPKKHCKACSLTDVCLPKLAKAKLVEDYIHKALEVNECENC